MKPPAGDRGALGLGLGDPARHPVSLAGGDQGGDVGGFVERVAHHQGLDVGHQGFGELVGDRGVHQDPLGADAALAGMAEPGHLDLRRRNLPVAVRFDDARGVVAQFQPHPLARCPSTDAPAHVGRTGEGDQGDVGVVDDGIAHRGAASGDDLQIAGRQTALVDEHPGQGEAAEGCLAGRLEHHGAPGGDRRADLVHHQVEGEVERGDGADNADGNPQGEAELALTGRDRVEGDHLPT